MFDSSMELPDFFRNGHRPPFLLGQAYAVLTGNSASPGEHLSKELIESRLAFAREQLEELASKGATHLLLNPVCRYTEQVEALAEVTGLK